MKTLTFNGQTLPDWLWIIKEPLHLAAPISWSYMQRKTGLAPTKQYIGARELSFDVSILAEDETDLHRKAEELAAILYSTEPKVLTRSSEPGRQYKALWERNEAFNKILETGEGTLLFIVPGGLKEGEQRTAATFSASQVLTIDGSYKTPPKFSVSFTGSATNYKIQNAAGQYVNIIRSFISGDKLVIDCEKELITLNGNNIMPALDLNSKFFYLEPGSNTLTVTASNQTTQATFTEKWL